MKNKIIEKPYLDGDDNLKKIKKILGSALLITMMSANNVDSQVIYNVASQKDAINRMISEGKILPNVPTDFGEFGRSYPSEKISLYNRYPYGKRQKYEAKNLQNIDGKNIEIDNDVDSCMFLLETVYKDRLKDVIPVIFDDNMADTAYYKGEFKDGIDRENSKDFTGLGLVAKTQLGTGMGTHGTNMAKILAAKKNNYTEENYVVPDKNLYSSVGMRPGKTWIYTDTPYNGGLVHHIESFSSILDIARKNTNKKYILSCSWNENCNGERLNIIDQLGQLNNVLILVARDDVNFQSSPESFGKHPATVQIGQAFLPDVKFAKEDDVVGSDFKLTFAGNQKDWIVPPSSQSGDMDGDAFCILGEWTTSESTAAAAAYFSYLWAQNPDMTKDQILDMAKKYTYKSSEYIDDARGFNPKMGYGIMQTGKGMKENIMKGLMKEDLLSDQETPLNKKDGKFYFGVPNFGSAEYSIVGEGIKKDDKGYYIDLTNVASGKHKITFVGKCVYKDGKTYDFPISREITVIGLDTPVVTGISGNRKRINQDPSQQKVYFNVLKGQITNYKAGLKVNLKFNNSTIIENVVVDSQGKFDLTNLINYPIAYKTGDGDIKLTIELVNSQGDKTSTDIMLTADLVTDVGDMTIDGGFSSTKIYPNPVRDILNIDLPFGFDNVNLKIFNSVGQLYSASNLSSDNNQVDVSSLKTGIYFVTITDDNGNKKTEKIIKQ